MAANLESLPCQNCGRCTNAQPHAGWLPLDEQAAALVAGASAAGHGAARAVAGSAGGRDLSDSQVAGLVASLVREALGGPGAAVAEAAGGFDASASPRGFEIPVGISVRHVHICQKDMDVLFGPGAALTKKSDLFEPGEFAAQEVVTLVGPKLRAVEKVRILGPMREFTQVELSRTDAVCLGLDLPMRRSGDLKGAAPLTLVGPAGSLTLPQVAIRSNRHIHMSDRDAERFGVRDNDIVRVRVAGEEGVIYENVQVRVNPSWLLTMHVDTDDANASNLFCNMKAYLLPGR